MRRWGNVIAALAIGLGLATATLGRAGEPDDEYPDTAAPPPARARAQQRPGLIDYMFGWAPRPAKASPPARTSRDKPGKPAPEAAAKPERPAPPVESEQEAFLRRLAVCDRLRRVAEETNDDQLHQLADELQDRAWQLCVQRAHIDTSGVDETVLDSHLAPTSPGTALTAPGRTTAGARSERPAQARVKETTP